MGIGEAILTVECDCCDAVIRVQNGQVAKGIRSEGWERFVVEARYLSGSETTLSEIYACPTCKNKLKHVLGTGVELTKFLIASVCN